MSNLTIAIDDELLRAARIKAVAEGTSVNEVCRKAIERYACGSADAASRLATLRAIAKKTRAARDGMPAWSGREAFYDEVLRERGLIDTKPSKPLVLKAARRR